MVWLEDGGVVGDDDGAWLLSSWLLLSTANVLLLRARLEEFLFGEEGLVTLLSLGRVLALCHVALTNCHGRELTGSPLSPPSFSIALSDGESLAEMLPPPNDSYPGVLVHSSLDLFQKSTARSRWEFHCTSALLLCSCSRRSTALCKLTLVRLSRFTSSTFSFFWALFFSFWTFFLSS